MTARLILSLLLGLAGVRLLVASPGPPLVPGEQLKYSVSFAIVPGAGEITVAAEPSVSGKLKITTTTATRRLARILLPFDATAESIYDVKTSRLQSLHERSQQRGKHNEHLVNFDYDARRASYVAMGATAPRFLTMPDGDPNDLITALLDTRSWNLKPGESRDALVLFNDDFYELTIHALRYEEVTTDLGTFNALVLEPKMEKTPPKGMFAKGSTVRVWISQDERKLPVKFEVDFNIGTGVAQLVEYTPPGASSPANVTAEHASSGASSGPSAQRPDDSVSN
jgi:hypothetical protein